MAHGCPLRFDLIEKLRRRFALAFMTSLRLVIPAHGVSAPLLI
ncbi:hypothetical protein FSU_0986 [Fibrobacter succinogenes subsp. succinogenes S85]|uniref:Uncharacterized protein n=1 Tax=Fibrobacter succinogenes (strain ATCC 19169 / S85) TaxID=59374 RepID=D9S8Y0_FIBSS|nr:hypothetical protein FSU_0986 [Fibrobacter succinogenes subsp. succinogenes S85]